jgi:hypothetical protein
LVKAKDAVERLGRKYFHATKVDLYDGKDNVELNGEQTIEQAFRGTQLVCNQNGEVNPGVCGFKTTF